MSEQKTVVHEKLDAFLESLQSVSSLFESVCKQHNVTDGVSLTISAGSVKTFTDVGEFRKD